tara:strand:- start:527 stop:781 length:255 start_codon:yes stop_codon:yes gene_type:complete
VKKLTTIAAVEPIKYPIPSNAFSSERIPQSKMPSNKDPIDKSNVINKISPHTLQDLHSLSELTGRAPHQTHPVNDVVSVGLTSL